MDTGVEQGELGAKQSWSFARSIKGAHRGVMTGTHLELKPGGSESGYMEPVSERQDRAGRMTGVGVTGEQAATMGMEPENGKSKNYHADR